MSGDLPDPPRDLEETLRTFADRIFRTGGVDPGSEALAMPEERLAIYRDLVRGNYESMLRFAFTQTMRLLDHMGENRGDAPGLPASGRATVARFLEVSPATTHSTREICDRFRAFLPAEYGGLATVRPDLADLVTLERAEIEAYYHEDDPGRGPTGDEAAALPGLSVEQFLALRVLRAPSATTLRLGHATTPLHDALERRDPPPPPDARPERVTASRNPHSLLPMILVHDEGAFGVFETSVPGHTEPLEALAERWFTDLPEEVSAQGEEACFSVFAGAVLKGLGAGFYRLPDA